jgi:hypothetical protein
VVSVERVRRYRTWFVVGGCWFLVLAFAFWIRADFARWPAFILGAAAVLFAVAIWMHHRTVMTDRTSSDSQQTRQNEWE